MEKFKKYWKGIYIGLMFGAGVITIIFGKTKGVQFGLTMLFWGLATFVLVAIAKERHTKELIEFDEQSKLILIDIEQKGAESEYYSSYNLQIINNLRSKFIKKQNKQLFSFVILGVVLLITCLLCLI